MYEEIKRYRGFDITIRLDDVDGIMIHSYIVKDPYGHLESMDGFAVTFNDAKQASEKNADAMLLIRQHIKNIQ